MKLIHFTDTHFVEPGVPLFGLDPRQRLDACIDDINLHHAGADLCVITGDLTHWGEAAAYENLKDCLARLKPPLRLILGNHDNRETFLRYFPETPVDTEGFVQSVLDTPAGRFLFLDTNQPGTHAGWYCEDRLDWLHRRLAEADDDTPLYIFMHHPPFEIGIRHLDAIGLVQAKEFGRIVVNYTDKVRHLFFGHVHRPVSGSWLGIPFSTLRATNHQCWLDFEETPQMIGSHEPPAYAVVLLHDDRVVIHAHDFLDTSPKFNMGAQTRNERELSIWKAS